MWVSIASFVEFGGPVLVLLLLLSVFAFALVLIKFVQFLRGRVGNHVRAKEALALWRDGVADNALSVVELGQSASSQCTAQAIRLAGDENISRQEAEERISHIAVSRLHQLQRGLRAMDAIAQTAPLLGLFGTVLGMIEAFQQLQQAGNNVDPSLLAGGIWVALLTTAAGLAIAMPLSLVLTWFEGRLEDERIAIQTICSEILSTRPCISS